MNCISTAFAPIIATLCLVVPYLSPMKFLQSLHGDLRLNRDTNHNHIMKVFSREGRTVVSVADLRFQARGLLLLNGAELRGGVGGGGEQNL